MTREYLLTELEELGSYLRLVGVAINKGYYGAAGAYLDDIEGGVRDIRKMVDGLKERKLSGENLLHVNDPAFEPLPEKAE
jgi:hypothetical protein